MFYIKMLPNKKQEFLYPLFTENLIKEHHENTLENDSF